MRAVESSPQSDAIDLDDLIRQHSQGTGICSSWRHAQQISPTIADIRAAGPAAIPALLRNIAQPFDPDRGVGAGPAILPLLWEASGVDPAHGTTTIEAAKHRWIGWGLALGHLRPEDVPDAGRMGA